MGGNWSVCFWFLSFFVKLIELKIVQALSQKYKTAKVALGPVQLAFKDLTSAVGNPSWIKEWELLEAHAMKERGKAMMIYNVSPIEGILCLLPGSNAH